MASTLTDLPSSLKEWEPWASHVLNDTGSQLLTLKEPERDIIDGLQNYIVEKAQWDVPVVHINCDLTTKPGDFASVFSGLSAGSLLIIRNANILKPSLIELIREACEDHRVTVNLGEGPTAQSLIINMQLFACMLILEGPTADEMDQYSNTGKSDDDEADDEDDDDEEEDEEDVNLIKDILDACKVDKSNLNIPQYLEKIPGVKEIARRAIENWIKPLKNPDLKNYHQKIDIVHIELVPTYSLECSYTTEVRTVKELRSSYASGQDLAYNINNIDPWSFTYSVTDAIKRGEKTDIRLPGSRSLPCSSCNSQGKLTCSSCNGAGQGTCSSCNGSGQLVCGGCHGSGQYKCTTCGGSGRKECWWCSGKGFKSVPNTRTMERCHSCGGQGSSQCSCGNGIENCGSCGGHGSFQCSCGNGIATCSSCSGSGILTCGSCNEAGRIAFFPAMEVKQTHGDFKHEPKSVVPECMSEQRQLILSQIFNSATAVDLAIIDRIPDQAIAADFKARLQAKAVDNKPGRLVMLSYNVFRDHAIKIYCSEDRDDKKNALKYILWMSSDSIGFDGGSGLRKRAKAIISEATKLMKDGKHKEANALINIGRSATDDDDISEKLFQLQNKNYTEAGAIMGMTMVLSGLVILVIALIYHFSWLYLVTSLLSIFVFFGVGYANDPFDKRGDITGEGFLCFVDSKLMHVMIGLLGGICSVGLGIGLGWTITWAWKHVTTWF